MSEAGKAAQPALRRALGPFRLFAYTLGGMLGAGIYGLVGRAAGELGSAVLLQGVPAVAVSLGFLLVVTGIVLRGIRESMW